MGLLEFVIIIAVLGLIWWLVTTYVPLPPAGKTIVTVVFVVVLVALLLQVFGLTNFNLRLRQ